MGYSDIVASRYWCTDGVPIAIVAIEGGAQDVAAYIGADRYHNAHEADTLRHVSEHGAKLTREEAFAFLPQLKDVDLAYRD